MDIRPSRDAEATQLHPSSAAILRPGREGLFSCFGYIVGIEGMPEAESTPLLIELYAVAEPARIRSTATSGGPTCC